MGRNRSNNNRPGRNRGNPNLYPIPIVGSNNYSFNNRIPRSHPYAPESPPERISRNPNPNPIISKFHDFWNENTPTNTTTNFDSSIPRNAAHFPNQNQIQNFNRNRNRLPSPSPLAPSPAPRSSGHLSFSDTQSEYTNPNHVPVAQLKPIPRPVPSGPGSSNNNTNYQDVIVRVPPSDNPGYYTQEYMQSSGENLEPPPPLARSGAEFRPRTPHLRPGTPQFRPGQDFHPRTPQVGPRAQATANFRPGTPQFRPNQQQDFRQRSPQFRPDTGEGFYIDQQPIPGLRHQPSPAPINPLLQVLEHQIKQFLPRLSEFRHQQPFSPDSSGYGSLGPRPGPAQAPRFPHPQQQPQRSPLPFLRNGHSPAAEFNGFSQAGTLIPQYHNQERAAPILRDRSSNLSNYSNSASALIPIPRVDQLQHKKQQQKSKINAKSIYNYAKKLGKNFVPSCFNSSSSSPRIPRNPQSQFAPDLEESYHHNHRPDFWEESAASRPHSHTSPDFWESSSPDFERESSHFASEFERSPQFAPDFYQESSQISPYFGGPSHYDFDFTPPQSPPDRIYRNPVCFATERPTPALLYHYTNRAGAEGILKSGYLRVSETDLRIRNLNITSPNARHGRGIYFTDVPPELSTREILRNNYGITERFRDRAEFCFEFKSSEIPQLEGPFIQDNYGNTTLKDRLIWITKVHKFFLDKRKDQPNVGKYYERLEETGENADRQKPRQVIPHVWRFEYNPNVD